MKIDNKTEYILKKQESQRSQLKEKTVNSTNESTSPNPLKNPEYFSEIITQDKKMYALLKKIEEIEKSTLPVLITGESGTGKGLIARAIHKTSRRKGDFVVAEVGGLNEADFSRELFGHEDDLSNNKPVQKGLVEKAKGGTLFLNEIGDIPIQSQVSLLKLIQEMEDSLMDIEVQSSANVRIIMATSRILDAMIKTAIFHNDLYNRFIKPHIDLPPLRDRKEDIPLLLESFLEQSAKKLNKKVPDYPQELLELLSSYDFPGNVRELAGMVFYAMTRHKDGPLSLDTFRETINEQKKKAENKMFFGSSFPTFEEMKEIYLKEAMKQANEDRILAAKLSDLNEKNFNKYLKEIKYKSPKNRD